MAVWPPIPGETPIDDISGLIPKGVTSRERLNELEAENIRIATVRYFAAKPSKRQAPFTIGWCLKLHKQMFGKVWRWAGTIRSVELNIGVPAHRIQMDLQVLLDDLAYWREKNVFEPIEQAARLHHRAVHIHPFMNGNGRWSRFLANIWLKQLGIPLTAWPDETIGNESVIRGDYIKAIQLADKNDYAALIELHRKFAES